MNEEGREKWLISLRQKEAESIVKGFASLTFLRAQGRTLERGSQKRFLDFAWSKLAPALIAIQTRSDFDAKHHSWVEAVQDMMLTSAGERLSYGQGQKSINVFLKFYVDWASLPDPIVATRLRPWLHCPLDRVVMEGLARSFPDFYRTNPGRFYAGPYQQRFSLSLMTKEAYFFLAGLDP